MKFRVHVCVKAALLCALCLYSVSSVLNLVPSLFLSHLFRHESPRSSNHTHRAQTNPCSPNRNKRNKAPPVRRLPHPKYKIQFPGPIHPDATNSPATNPPKCATAPTPPPPARKNREKTLSSGILRAIRPSPARWAEKSGNQSSVCAAPRHLHPMPQLRQSPLFSARSCFFYEIQVHWLAARIASS